MNYRPELDVQIKQGIHKILIVPTWLANIVLVKKKGQFCCCIDFHDLNKGCPKDKSP